MEPILVWYVNGDPEKMLWKTKLDAEQRAREIWPDTPADRRYARISYREVHSYENQDSRSD